MPRYSIGSGHGSRSRSAASVDIPVEEERLRAVGKECFVTCFRAFKDAYRGLIDREALVELMYSDGGAVSDNSAQTKASAGLRIFREGLVHKALVRVAGSEKVSYALRSKAGEFAALEPLSSGEGDIGCDNLDDEQLLSACSQFPSTRASTSTGTFARAPDLDHELAMIFPIAVGDGNVTRRLSYIGSAEDESPFGGFSAVFRLESIDAESGQTLGVMDQQIQIVSGSALRDSVRVQRYIAGLLDKIKRRMAKLSHWDSPVPFDLVPVCT